jgi:TolB-like protein
MASAYHPGGEATTIAIPPPEGFALGLTEMLTTALVEADRFVVVDRARIDQVLAEQDFGASGRVNEETAPALGRAIGAQVLVTGGITEYSYTSSALGGVVSVLEGANVAARKVSAVVGLDLRLLDAETGEVLFSQRGSGDASAKMVEADVSVGEQAFSTELAGSTPLGKASRQAIEEVVAALVDGLADLEWTGRIVDVRDGVIYVNAGFDAGIETGMEFDVYEQQPALIDPATGQSLGAPERCIGRIRIVQVEDRYAVAEPLDGTDFQRDALLRFAGEPFKP